MMSELGVKPKLQFWAKVSNKRTRKIGLQRIYLFSSKPLRNGKKKHFRLWNRTIWRSELGVCPKLQFWAKMRRTQTRKIKLQGIQLLSSRTLKNGKKIYQALESLNSDVCDRSYVQITMLGQNEHETDTKNLTLTNSSSELTKNISRLLNRLISRSELGVSPKLQFWAKMRTQTWKIVLRWIQLLSSQTP